MVRLYIDISSVLDLIFDVTKMGMYMNSFCRFAPSVVYLCIHFQILLNEVAPRPHNSGHHTIESCFTSQYEQHLRAVVGLPLGDPSMRTPAAIMYNLLGEEEVN